MRPSVTVDNEWWRLRIGVLDMRWTCLAGAFDARASRLERTLSKALSSSENPVSAVESRAGGSTDNDDLLLDAHGVHPTLVGSGSSGPGDPGIWLRPENLRARLRRWEKKLSLTLPVGEARPLRPLRAFSAS